MIIGPDLPLELIQTILIHLPKVHYLTQTALVNLAFYQSTIPLLYDRVSIRSWHKKAKSRVIQLFRTLSSNAHLAQYIRRLEIRDFPKNLFPDEMLGLILQGLQNCTNLRSCTWTRDGSLTSDILLALLNPSQSSTRGSPLLSSLPSSSIPGHQLRELEINGHHSNLYDPKLLLNFRWLERICIIMPTFEVVQILEEWVKVVQESLKSLDVICKASAVITDDVLIRMAPSLGNLEFFHLAGCRKVTHKGIRAILTKSKNGIQNLGLQGVSSQLDLIQLLSTSIFQLPTLRNLHSLTLSIPPLDPDRESLSTTAMPAPTQGYDHNQTAMLLLVPESNNSRSFSGFPSRQSYTSILSDILTHHAPVLEKIQICGSHSFFDPFPEMSWLLYRLVKTHREKLKRISVYRILIDLEVIKHICMNCSALEELFVVVEPGKLNILADHVHHARSLKTIHVNYFPGDQFQYNDAPVLSLEAVEFVKRCDNPSITQFGRNSRVWLVNWKAVVKKDHDGNEMIECEISLGPYESSDVPEQFMVVRT